MRRATQQKCNCKPRLYVLLAIIFTPVVAVVQGTSETGGAGLPKPVVRLANGQELRDAAACKALNSDQVGRRAGRLSSFV